MQAPDDIGRDLPPELEGSEREALLPIARRLRERTPISAPFREDLRGRLLGAETRSRRPSPAPRATGVLRLAVSYATAGVILLAVAAAGLVGVGPFGSS